MKKMLSFLLTLALAVGLCAPAFAADAADQRAAAVTLAVKEKLELDTAEYDKFNSSYSENVLTPTWYLSWTGDNGSLSINVTEGGRIQSYSRYSYVTSAVKPVTNRGRFTPTFPFLTRDEAMATAVEFLDKALEADETVVLEPSAGPEQLSANSYSFYGNILVNGLPSPFSYSIRVGEDNTVSSFYRSGTDWARIMGSAPSAVPAATAEKAGAALRGTFSFRLEYVPDGDNDRAVLRYLPNSTHEFYVDARTGELVDLTELYARLGGSGRGLYMEADAMLKAESANVASGAFGLTEAELEGVAKLEGALSKEEIDAAARAMTALGLTEDYKLGNISFTVDPETEDVTARVQYTKTTEDGTWRRYVTMDGKTGELFSVSSSTPWMQELPKGLLSGAQAQARAEAFLATQCGEDFAHTALYNGDSALSESDSLTRSFNFSQKENGYFFSTNSLSVGVDCTDGSISSYYNNFNCDVTFASPEGIVDMDAAKDAWLGTYDVALRYLAVPKALDEAAPEFKALTEQGYTYLYTLELAYQLERESYASGVDAHTGEALVSQPSTVKTVTYDDLGRHWVTAKATRLAKYGVGWMGGSMLPNKTLTQLDWVALLVSTNGWLYDPETDSADYLYDRAYSMGILTKEERDDDAVIDRCQMVKLLLDCAGYGDVAQLPGIFRCDFTDAADIPGAYMGYVAIAWALGLVEGNTAGAFAPNASATRAEAATIIYRYLDR